MDTKGALETDSFHAHRYFLTITEELSIFVAVRQIKSKEDAELAVLKFLRFFKKQSRNTVGKIHTDDDS